MPVVAGLVISCDVLRSPPSSDGLRGDPCDTLPSFLRRPPDSVPPPYYYRRLPNGLEVLVMRYPHVPIAVVSVAVRAGFMFEDSSTRGYSPFFVNDPFWENAVYPTGRLLHQRIRQLGIMWRYNSWQSGAVMSLVLPANEYDEGLRLWAASLQSPFFREEEIKRKGTAYLKQMISYVSLPSVQIEMALVKHLYGKKYYNYAPFPPAPDIARDSRKIKDFFNARYRPDNMLIIIGGRVDPEGAFQRVRQYFGNWTPGARAAVSPSPCVPPLSHNTTFIEVIPALPTIEYAQAYQGPGLATDWRAMHALLILKELLSFEHSRFQKRLSACGIGNVEVAFSSVRIGGPFSFQITVPDTPLLDRSIQCLRREIDRLDSPGYLSGELFELARKRIKVKYRMRIDNPDKWINAQARRWGMASLDYAMHFEDYIDSISLKDVRDAIRKYLKRRHWVGGLFAPHYWEGLENSATVRDVRAISQYRWEIPLHTYAIPPESEHEIDDIVFLMALNPGKKLVVYGRGPDVDELLPMIQTAIREQGWDRRVLLSVEIRSVSARRTGKKNRISFAMENKW